MSHLPSPARETRVLFNHHAARLVKSIPPSHPPNRVNGHIPRDHLGPGSIYQAHAETIGVVLQDWQGKLQLCAVPDIPLSSDSDHHDNGGGSLVLTIEQPYNALAQVYGAQRRQVLPFRSYTTSAREEGQAMPENTVPRDTFVGLGAGEDGQYGGSFWFFEDVSEPGAEGRYRAEMAGMGKRAIWTLWLFDAQPHLVGGLRDVLAHYPLPSAEKTVIEVNGSTTSPPAPAPKPEELKAPAKARRPLPTPPAKKSDTEGSPPRRMPLGDITNVVAKEQQDSEEQQPQHQQPQPLPSSPLPATPAAVPVKPESLRHTSSPEEPLADADEVGEALRAVPRTPSPTQPGPSSLRHSLVAVDDATGAIVAVVAHNVELSTTSSASSHGTISSSTAPTPKPSVLRAADIYRDPDVLRSPSRKGSELGADTFAPPPIPAKDQEEAIRDSVASSANFFSAQEEISDADSSEEGDEVDEVELRNGAAQQDGFTSLTRKAAKHGIASHRPELLRDDGEDDDGAVSDASGSTVGGPAVQLWRKARGGREGEKKRAAKKQEKEDRKIAEAEAKEAAIREAKEAAEREAKAKEQVKNTEKTLPRPAQRDSIATLEDLSPQETTPATNADDTLAAETHKLLLHGHVPRALMCTTDFVSAEDRVWREAIEAGHLPIDGAYTHLVALPGTSPSAVATPIEEKDEGEDDLSLDPAARDAQEIRLPARKYLQGGTVLIEFLAGGSRIGASLLGTSGPEEQEEEAIKGTSEGAAPAASSNGNGVLSLIPALPSHFLAYFTAAASASTTALPSAASSSWETATTLATGSRNLLATSVTSAISGISGFTSYALSAPGALMSWFAMPDEPILSASKEEEEDDDWEYAIPDFDPTSLASTPRPVYRRKRPAPSFEAGFNVRRAGDSNDETAIKGKEGGDDAAQLAPIPSSFSRRTGQQALRDAQRSPQAEQRYSIIHFDGDGVGRRAFFRGEGMGHSPYTSPLGPL
ncbi:hypothetical protein BDZ90DRAFT_107052 [Jaminaea rosea]|uniref:Uncharacterized protein n=1 Tax=Jaminaea rosea TaxID=1569628 RepID=A0A316UVQ2_9BASI|nr:hypothetical protein BDZ90DRAFT_107052 [Jaminaea rosea]PWN29377.1 hypothetical protein BDZ90DRAFT_107052 [Jaminaea rosea]